MKNSTARSLFPEIFPKVGKRDIQSREDKPASNIYKLRKPKIRKKTFRGQIPPPSAPDVSWLREENLFLHQQLDEERNRVLIVTGNVDSGTIIKNTIESIKFRAEVTDAPEKAIEIIRSTNISVLFVDFSVDFMAVHQYVCWLPSDIRRNIIYVLVGSNFHTLYDLEALSYSANLVINIRDLKYLEKIFLKVATDHQLLFSPILDMLKVKKIKS